MSARTGQALAILALAGLALGGCDLPVQQSGGYGSGGQSALPDMSQSLTGMTVFQRASSPGANDRNGGGTP